jgi:sulfate adenylyltransferase
LLAEAKSFQSITINTWAISDLDLIGVGAFPPLTGFMNEADYQSVAKDMRLANGTVWSIPITLAVDAAKAAELSVGERAALTGEDGVIYAIINIDSIYTVDHKVEDFQNLPA